MRQRYKSAIRRGGSCKNMKLKELKLLFENGILREARILPAPMQSGHWVVEIAKAGQAEAVTIEKQRGGVRFFATLDAAYSLVREIGFRKALIHE